MIEVSDARYADEAETLINCTAVHPAFGPIPFTASADDRTPFGRQVWAALQSATVADYEAPAPVVPAEVTKIQLVRALRDAELWEDVRAAIAGASVTIQEDWEFATILPRNDPLVVAFAAALGLTDAQGDAIFIAAGAI